MTVEFDDSLYQREYDFVRYNCFHFFCELLSTMTGNDISYERILDDIHGAKRGARRDFVQVREPKTGTLCLFKSLKSDELHCGFFYRGRVLHIRESGVSWQPLHIVMLMYRKVIFYDYCNNN